MPLTGPQTLAYQSRADELFFGGAAGGSKSWLLLGLAATAHRRSLILRRQATQLKELNDGLFEITDAESRRWRAIGYGGLMRLDGDRQIELAGVDQERDKEKWKGRRHDLKGFDEIGDFSQTQYEFINIWNGTPFPNQRVRRVATGNPPTTAEGEWIIKHWGPWIDEQHPNPAKPTELRWYARIDGKLEEQADGKPIEWNGRQVVPESRTFIPAKLSDNPILEATGYGNRLAALPEPLRSMFLEGNFSAGREDHEWQVIPTLWVQLAQRRWKPDGRSDARLECVGVDPARGGADNNVIAKRYANWFAPLISHPGKSVPDGPAVAGLVLMEMTESGDIQAAIHIDVIGIGSSPYDALKDVKTVRLNVRPINFGEASDAKDRAGVMRMRNVRAEAYWNMREALDPVRGDNLALPPDPELLADLTAPRWENTLSGILIESKDDIKARIGRSPDKGDAVVMACLPVRKMPDFGFETFG